ncbi:MAG: hypothetical protein AAB865_02035 [Patescibacteria group bacterium]
MQPLSLKATGWAASISWEFLTVLMLVHMYLLGDSPGGQFQTLWLQTLYPGYQTLNATGIVVALVQGFLWPWVFAGMFVTIYNRVLR